MRADALRFDDSADASSIGAGTFDPARAMVQPLDPEAGNVPYRIAGLDVADRLSFSYASAYRLGHRACADMRAAGAC